LYRLDEGMIGYTAEVQRRKDDHVFRLQKGIIEMLRKETEKGERA
jgi:hypothetical protein